ncbi:hypothetical protein BDQ17DRAFT_1333619 [Cyathus striatus]|nr:hypothetical protein BDQ17DRAFT_1333619 [Cyathus striatus]
MSSRAAEEKAKAHSNASLLQQQLSEDRVCLKLECKVLLGSNELGKSTIAVQRRFHPRRGDAIPSIRSRSLGSSMSPRKFKWGEAVGTALGHFGGQLRYITHVKSCIHGTMGDGAGEMWRSFQAPGSLLAEKIYAYRLNPPQNESSSEWVNETPSDPYSTGATDGVWGNRDKAYDRAVIIQMIDAGCRRLERKKWECYFEDVTSINFCASLSEYDPMLPEENKRVTKVPLERYLDGYTGGCDANKATKYILWKFMALNRARLSIHPRTLSSFVSTLTVMIE